MGKTFEALERAKQESGRNTPDVSKEKTGREFAAPAEYIFNPMVMESGYELKSNLLNRNPEETIKSIMFVGTSPGDGSSTVSLNYATILSEDTGRTVLLMDLNGSNFNQHERSGTDAFQELIYDDIGEEKKILKLRKMGQGNLYLLDFGNEYVKFTNYFGSDRIDRFLNMVYERFDYFIISSNSVIGSFKVRALCAKVDGVVLVILSGKTRRQIAIKAKEVIEAARGKLLGVVLNKRKYYIPEWIYRRL